MECTHDLDQIMTPYAIVVPWVTNEEIDAFCEAWDTDLTEPWLIAQHDELHEGCGTTKNKGVDRAVNQLEAEIVIVLDGDCYPYEAGAQSLPELAEAHIKALEPKRVKMYEAITDPPSRGTPYFVDEIVMEVAASMGFWMGNGDHCSVRQLAGQRTDELRAEDNVRAVLLALRNEYRVPTEALASVVPVH